MLLLREGDFTKNPNQVALDGHSFIMSQLQTSAAVECNGLRHQIAWFFTDTQMTL